MSEQLKLLQDWHNKRIKDSRSEFLDEGSIIFSHYTSLYSLESILSTKKIWFSNPLFMNDKSELSHAFYRARDIFIESDVFKCLGSPKRIDMVKKHFHERATHFEKEHYSDVYVFCFCQHEPNDDNGKLSMWRGYGGRGEGAAIVFNSSFLSNDTLPINISKVQYSSYDHLDDTIHNVLRELSHFCSDDFPPDEYIKLISDLYYEHAMHTALTWKHEGFSEEREWRLIYFPEWDLKGTIKEFFGYTISSRGVEPKLKLPIGPLPGDTTTKFDIHTVVEKIILGPTLSSPLAIKAFYRMLDVIGMPELKQKVRASNIPFRPF